MGQGQSRYCPFAFCALVLFGCDDIPCRFPFLAEGERRKIMSKQKKYCQRVGLFSQKYYLCTANATIAQSVEHFIRNEKVPGSSPGRGSESKRESIHTVGSFFI